MGIGPMMCGFFDGGAATPSESSVWQIFSPSRSLWILHNAESFGARSQIEASANNVIKGILLTLDPMWKLSWALMKRECISVETRVNDSVRVQPSLLMGRHLPRDDLSWANAVRYCKFENCVSPLQIQWCIVEKYSCIFVKSYVVNFESLFPTPAHETFAVASLPHPV